MYVPYQQQIIYKRCSKNGQMQSQKNSEVLKRAVELSWIWLGYATVSRFLQIKIAYLTIANYKHSHHFFIHPHNPILPPGIIRQFSESIKIILALIFAAVFVLWLKYIIINLNLLLMFYLQCNFNKVNKDTESESLTLIYETLLAITKILCGFRKMETTMLNNIRLNYAFSSTRD